MRYSEITIAHKEAFDGNKPFRLSPQMVREASMDRAVFLKPRLSNPYSEEVDS